MSADIKAIGPQGVTPRVVLESVAQILDDVEDIFVVTFSQDGTPTVWTSGCLSRLSTAALCLQDSALSVIRGEFDPEAHA